MGRFEDALKYSGEAIEKNPENSENYANKANVLSVNTLDIQINLLNRDEEALIYYNQAIQKNPENSIYYANKGFSDSQYHLAKTLQVYKKFIQLNKMKKLEDALKMFNKAIKKNPENPQYFYCKANNLLSGQLLKVKQMI